MSALLLLCVLACRAPVESSPVVTWSAPSFVADPYGRTGFDQWSTRAQIAGHWVSVVRFRDSSLVTFRDEDEIAQRFPEAERRLQEAAR